MKSRSALLLSALLGLSATGADELAANAAMPAGCVATRRLTAGVEADAPAPAELSLVLHVGSRLLARGGGRLELLRGAPLPCADGLVQTLQAALRDARSGLPPEHLPRPLRVHVDPRLPAGEAPLSGAEVHVSSRELLVTRAALGSLPTEVWRHELLHALAAPPPPASDVARRLWLTLEEGLVQYAAQHTEQLAPALGGTAAPGLPLPPPPVWEQLALPAYDPHELAQGWASELERTRPLLELTAAVSCLSTPPAATAMATLQQAAQRFAERCPPAVAPVLQRALQRWLPEEWQAGSGQPGAAAAAFSRGAR